MKIKRNKKRVLVLLLSMGMILILDANYTIQKQAEGKLFTDVNAIPKHKVGLVLGTAKTLKNGRINVYFTYRIQATVQLFKSGKIDLVLVSGDNGNEQYDEPTDFKEELIRQGIPASKIYLDYAGFRTLDSVVRAKEIFGQNSITIISQQFHNERAIYLAKAHGIEAIGFNAKDVSVRYGLKVKLREYLARTKVFIDILFGVQPKYLGEKIEMI